MLFKMFQTSMNVPRPMTATLMQPALTQKAVLSAFATVGTPEMVSTAQVKFENL